MMAAMDETKPMDVAEIPKPMDMPFSKEMMTKPQVIFKKKMVHIFR